MVDPANSKALGAFLGLQQQKLSGLGLKFVAIGKGLRDKYPACCERALPVFGGGISPDKGPAGSGITRQDKELHAAIIGLV